MIYADTSFTFSLYAHDNNTAEANRIYQADKRRPLIFTEWQELELHNTFRLGVNRARRDKTPVRYQPENCIKRIGEDLRNGVLRRSKLEWTACVRRAAQLSQAHTESTGVVMLDLWHIACALELGAMTFWTFDDEQADTARATGQFKTVVGPKS